MTLSGQNSWRIAFSSARTTSPAAAADCSLALRLLDAGVADDVVSSYLQIEPECLPDLIDLARRKLLTALSKP